MKKPTIKTARWFAEHVGARGAVLLVLDDDGQLAGASWGKTRSECALMGAALDRLVDRLEQPEPSLDGSWQGFRDQCLALLARCEELPERAEDFAGSIIEKVEGMAEWAEENEHATEAMRHALENMADAVERLLR